MNVAYNIDCMEYMKTLPDNAFELAVVDPPYGDAQQEQEFREQGAHFVGRGRSARYLGDSASTNKPLRFHGGDRWNKYLQQPTERERERM